MHPLNRQGQEDCKVGMVSPMIRGDFTTEITEHTEKPRNIVLFLCDLCGSNFCFLWLMGLCNRPGY